MQAIEDVSPSGPIQIRQLMDTRPSGPIHMVNLLKFTEKTEYYHVLLVGLPAGMDRSPLVRKISRSE